MSFEVEHWRLKIFTFKYSSATNIESPSTLFIIMSLYKRENRIRPAVWYNNIYNSIVELSELTNIYLINKYLNYLWKMRFKHKVHILTITRQCSLQLIASSFHKKLRETTWNILQIFLQTENIKEPIFISPLKNWDTPWKELHQSIIFHQKNLTKIIKRRQNWFVAET